MKYTDINTKTIEELNTLLKEKETLLFELNLKLRTMQLTNSSEIRVAKKILLESRQLLMKKEGVNEWRTTAQESYCWQGSNKNR